uniref:RING-type domain-containing protein n=1 Tax=Romanomermis culicivorax TaxID=13658 RepID=A0A915JF51_ROMCU
ATTVSKNEHVGNNYQQNSTVDHFPNSVVASPQPTAQQQSFYPNFYPGFPVPLVRPRNSLPPNLKPPNSPLQPPAGFYPESANLSQAKPPGLDTSLSDPIQLVRELQSNSSSGSGVNSESVPKINNAQSRPMSVPNDVQTPAAAVLAPPTPTNSGAGRSRPNSKFNQIFDHFAVLFPSATQEEVKNAIQEFRENQTDKKLSGKTMSQLKAGVEGILKRKFDNLQAAHKGSLTRASSIVSNRSSYKDASSTLASNAAARSTNITPQSNPNFPTTARHSPQRSQRQMPEECCICLEPMNVGEHLRLDCDHEAHKNCLRDWLSENKSCPICRKLALLEDEYPRL